MNKVIVSTQHNPYLNIAVENYLLSLPDDGNVFFYLWQNRRTVVIGQNQNPFSECNVERLLADGGYLMRRRTGGGAVFHDLGNLNFSFVVPYDRYDLMRQFSVLQLTLAAFGLTAEVSGRNDLLCQGRKFSGNAFSKSMHRRLHHGTILIKTDIDLLQRYLRVNPAKLHKHGVASVQSRVVNLSELVPPDATRQKYPEGITSQNIVQPLIDAFQTVYDAPIEVIDFQELLCLQDVQRVADEFASEQWLYGRWKTFSARREAQFDWGVVALSADVDEVAGVVRSVEIATDCLNIEAIQMVRQLLEGASAAERPALPDGIDASTAVIVGDVIGLLY